MAASMEKSRPNGLPRDEEPFSHNILDRDEDSRNALRLYLKPLILSTIMITLVIWGILSIFWGTVLDHAEPETVLILLPLVRCKLEVRANRPPARG